MQEKTEVEAELTVGFLAFKESYVSRVTCVPFKSVQVISTGSVEFTCMFRFPPFPPPGRRIVFNTVIQSLVHNMEFPKCCLNSFYNLNRWTHERRAWPNIGLL